MGFRGYRPGRFELRERNGDGHGQDVMQGYLARFNQWTEIDSEWEGHFLERIAPGAFKKTIAENRTRMKVLFNHGRDPTVGDKVLGKIEELREDETGAYFVVPLLDTSYNRDLIPGLRAGLYGSSFRFRTIKDRFDKHPRRSAHNPDGLPERTLTEVRLHEFGPVSFPAYEGATAGLRSLSDHFIPQRAKRKPKPAETPKPRSDLFARKVPMEEQPWYLPVGERPWHLSRERR